MTPKILKRLSALPFGSSKNNESCQKNAKRATKATRPNSAAGPAIEIMRICRVVAFLGSTQNSEKIGR